MKVIFSCCPPSRRISLHYPDTRCMACLIGKPKPSHLIREGAPIKDMSEGVCVQISKSELYFDLYPDLAGNPRCVLD
jgi:hypothetical protein